MNQPNKRLKSAQLKNKSPVRIATKEIATESNLIETTLNNKCSQCTTSKCCQYITEPMDTPRSIRDFDMILWQVSHQNIHCFKDDSGWYLTSFGQCEHLSDNGQCGIYQQRPFICREHSNHDCEYDRPPKAFTDLYFTNHEEFDQYCRNRFKKWDSRFD